MNNIQKQLINLKIIKPKAITLLFPRVRDNKNIQVMQCEDSGVIFLKNSKHISKEYYSSKQDYEYWGSIKEQALIKQANDDTRRLKDFRNEIMGKIWMEVGGGMGGLVELAKNIYKEVIFVEPQPGPRKYFKNKGKQTYESINNVNRKDVELATLFHSFEHFNDPLNTLIEIRKRIKKGGKIIIEVPHAKDILISYFNLESFKSFTFWSEHLILHTRGSLSRFLTAAGFNNIEVYGLQRYPLANHLYWLIEGKPGGQNIFSDLNEKEINNQYEKLLKELDMTDTLIAIAKVLD